MFVAMLMEQAFVQQIVQQLILKFKLYGKIVQVLLKQCLLLFIIGLVLLWLLKLLMVRKKGHMVLIWLFINLVRIMHVYGILQLP